MHALIFIGVNIKFLSMSFRGRKLSSNLCILTLDVHNMGGQLMDSTATLKYFDLYRHKYIDHIIVRLSQTKWDY